MKRLIILTFCCVLVGCATRTRMSSDDLWNFKYDCSHRQEQWNFLESQKYTSNERFMLGMQMTSISGMLTNIYHGTANDSGKGMGGEHEIAIKHAQRRLREQCYSEDYNAAQKLEQEKRLRQRELEIWGK